MILPKHIEKLHEKIALLSERYKTSEIELLDSIIEARRVKLHRHFECASLYEYCTRILKLDAGVVYGFMAVANRAADVPELRQKINDRAFSVSTAKRITSALTLENKREWFEKAETLSNRQLEKEVARVNPKAEVKERASYLNSKRVKLEMGLDEELMLEFRRAQDLESQRRQKPASLEETLATMLKMYLQKNDPVEKAKRAKVRKSTPRPSARKGKKSNQSPEVQPTPQYSRTPKTPRSPIPSSIVHEVNFRDQGECQFVQIDTLAKCKSRRFIEIHHKKPVSEGGDHDLENLITVCSEHHKIIHQRPT